MRQRLLPRRVWRRSQHHLPFSTISRRPMSNGYILYEGPSMLDGAPIVMIGTGFWNRSANPKTGDMIQTWIIRQDQPPLDAVLNGDDKSVCGNCPLRRTTCYVNTGRAPNNVWKAYAAGRYLQLPELRLFANRAVRFGAYGDPAAVPVELISRIAGAAVGYTGYTHQWRTCDQRLRNFCMASADCVDDYRDAKRLGWRVFRIRAKGDSDRFSSEAVCPASEEQGYKLTCDQCLACNGTASGRRGDIVISVHGTAARVQNYERTFKGIPLKVAA